VQCQSLDFSQLFWSNNRSPDPDFDWLREINSLGNINSQMSYPFCRILSEVVASGYFEARDKDSEFNYGFHDPNAVYMPLTMLFAGLRL
jgi:hypothetical protein